MRYEMRVCLHREERRVATSARREPGGDVQKLAVGQSHQRPAHKRTECKRVERVGKNAEQREDVLRLLPPHQGLTGLRRNRKTSRLERAFITPELGVTRGEQCNVACPQWRLRIVGAPYYNIANQPFTNLRDSRSFRFAEFVCIDPFLDLNREPSDASHGVGALGDSAGKRDIGRLEGLTENSLETLI